MVSPDRGGVRTEPVHVAARYAALDAPIGSRPPKSGERNGLEDSRGARQLDVARGREGVLRAHAGIAAAVAGIITPSAKDHVRAHPDGRARFFLRTGIIVILLGGLNAMLVVTPRLRARTARAEAPTNSVYFGHLMHRDPREGRPSDGRVVRARR